MSFSRIFTPEVNLMTFPLMCQIMGTAKALEKLKADCVQKNWTWQ